MASSDLTLFNLAIVLVVLLIQTVQFSGCQTNESLLPSPTSNASDEFKNSIEELCRAIEGTKFHEQCLQSEVVKQKGFIPRHLRPPWLNVSLFEDNQLPEEKALGNGCYACYKGSTASNRVNPDEEYCACAFNYGAPNKKFGKIFGTFKVDGSTCLEDFHKMGLMPTCGNEYYDYVKHCAMVHFYKNEPDKKPDDVRHERTLVLLDGCITGASHNCTANVTIQFAEPPKALSIDSCNEENKTVFESTIHLKESSGKHDIGAASTFTFPVEFKHRLCVSWLQFAKLRALPYYELITVIISGDCGTKSFSLPRIESFRGRVQEMRGLHLDLRGEAAQWRDQFGVYDFVRHNDLNWQPTDLKLINNYGQPNPELMYPNFVLKSIGHASFSVDILKMFYHYNTAEIYAKNLILSPLSAAIALAMAYIGARGQTSVELGKVLAGASRCHSCDGPSLRDNYSKFLQEIGATQTDANFNLKISTKLFLADSVKVLDEFKLAINAHFGEDNFESIDFRQQSEVAKKINAFLDKASPGGKSIESIKPQSLNPTITKLVLVSAINFQANWLQPFDPQYTEKKKFVLTNDQEREVDMMLQIGEFMHMEEEEFELLGVPYVDEKAHFVILLPKGQFFGLEIGLNTFNGAKLMEFVEKSAMKERKVILPKFKIESVHHNLEEALLLLGIKRAFRPSKADFSGINYNNLSYTLYINKVIQKTHISIDEHGTTSASTAVPKSVDGSFGSNREPAGTPTFQADRPFAFFIILNKKHVMFSGIFMGEQ